MVKERIILFEFGDFHIPSFSEFKELISGLNDLTKETIEDIGNDFKVFGREMKEGLCNDIEDKAYIINYNLGESVHSLNEKRRKAQKIGETLGNIGHKYVGEVCKDYQLADHLYIQNSKFEPLYSYSHHGIYVGNNKVIHYNKDEYGDICVFEVSLDEFSNSKTIYRLSLLQSPLRFSPQEAVNRAYRCIGKNDYNLFFNNCENFVRWCRFGAEDYRIGD